MSAVLDKIKSRNGGEIVTPLWKLKITDEEYLELKDHIRFCIKDYIIDRNNAFGRRPDIENAACEFCRTSGQEIVLLYAEFWRREYISGSHRDEDVFNALGLTEENPEIRELFDKAAKYGIENRISSGWKRLGLKEGKDIYVNLTGRRNNTEYTDSFLYQGGMPMNSIVSSDDNIWNVFFDRLIEERVDFEELRMGIVAENVAGPKEFCRGLIYAFKKLLPKFRTQSLGIEDLDILPFECKSRSNQWFQYLMKKADPKRRAVEQRSRMPISIMWSILPTNNADSFEISYEISAASVLSEDFLRENVISKEYEEIMFGCSIENASEEKPIDAGCFLYRRDRNGDFCQMSQNTLQNIYYSGDICSIVCNNTESTLLQRSFNMSKPFLAVSTAKGFEVRQGTSLDSKVAACYYIFIPQGWNVASSGHTRKVICSGEDFLIYEVPLLSGNLSVTITSNEGESIVFSQENEIVALEVAGSNFADFYSDKHEPVYDESRNDLRLRLTEQRTRSAEKRYLEYSSYVSNPTWTKTLPLGRVMARYKNNISEVVSERFINVSGLSIGSPMADSNSCTLVTEFDDQFDVCIPKGLLSGQPVHNVNTRTIKKIWNIKQTNLEDKRYIEVQFLHADAYRCFTLKYKAPFRDRAVYSSSGRKIGRDEVLSLMDLNRFYYRFIGGDTGIRLKIGWRDGNRWNSKCIDARIFTRGNTLYCRRENEELEGGIMNEGFLAALFRYTRPNKNGYEAIESMLKDCTEDIQIQYGEKRPFVDVALFNIDQNIPFCSFRIQEEPYKIVRTDNTITLQYENPFREDQENEIVYDHEGRLHYVDVRDDNPVAKSLMFDDGEVAIDDSLIDSGARVVFFGDPGEGITPRFENLSLQYTGSHEREENYNNFDRIKNELKTATLLDSSWRTTIKWYKLALKYGVKAQYFFHTRAVSENELLFLNLLWQLLLDCNTDEEKIALTRGWHSLFGNEYLRKIIYKELDLDCLSPETKSVNEIFDTESVMFHLQYYDWKETHQEGNERYFAIESYKKLVEYCDNIMNYVEQQ